MAKNRLTDAYLKNHALFATEELSNTVANTSNLYEQNGTIYIVSTWLNGQTFADAEISTLHDCIALVLSTAKVLKNIHEAGFLYLDLKPENILTIRGSLDLVQLFDFDSMISMGDLEAAIRSNDPVVLMTYYTRGYAPLELQTGKLRQIGRHTDLYSLGAVLFEALWHRTPTAFDCEENTEYDFSAMTYPRANYQDTLFRELTAFFHKTLASYHGDRYQDATEAITQLKTILTLADETRPYLFSTPVSWPEFFIGRETEIEALSHLLHTPGQHIFNLYGMGGIGKSTLVRAWLNIHRNEYDAVLWLYNQGKTAELICDDLAIHVNTVQRMKEESMEEYLKRKLRTLTEIVSRQHILVVVDNVLSEHLEDLRPLLNVGWHVLLISRAALAEGLYPSFCVEEMKINALASLFLRYAHAEISSYEDVRDFETIVNTVHGHTLTVELLGRQIARSYLTLHEAAEMVEQAGFRALPGEKINYIHDQQAFTAPLTKILDQLVEIDRFTEEEKQLLRILAMLKMPGIRVSLLRDLTSSEMIETVHRLESCGWLSVESQRIVFHPMMNEYIRTWTWTAKTRETLDGMLIRLHHKINPDEKQPDLDKQYPSDYRSLHELLSIAEQLLRFAVPGTPASQLLTFRVLMDAPVDEDRAVLDRMLQLLDNPYYLDERCVLRLYETSAFLLGRLEYYQDAYDVLKEMKAYLKKHPSHYYASWYHRAKAVIANNRFGREKDAKCLKHEDAAIREASASRHPDARRQLAAVLLNKTQTFLETRSMMHLCGEMLNEAGLLLKGEPESDYERYHYDCVSAVYYAMIGDEKSSLAHMRSATKHADEGKDSPLAFAEHLLDEAAVTFIELDRLTDAIDTVKEAIAICDEHEDIRRYREVRFDAYLFLGRIYAMNQEYVKAEETFTKAENHVGDSPHEWRFPLCPKDIREKARAERRRKAD
ncbi:MAG: AAA family ATPase [Clostridia bacterium]|nr:AAA family ATPase [Clostridia bacterium]